MGRKPKYENNHKVILDIAERLFGQYGFNRTSLDDIAKAASLGKASIYAEFSGKEELLVAVVVRFSRHVLAELDSLSAQVPADQPALITLRLGLLHHVMRLFNQAESYFHGDELLPPPVPGFVPERADVMLGLMHELHTWIARQIEEAIKHKEVPAHLDPLETARLIHAALMSCYPPIVIMQQLTADQVKQRASELLDMLLSGLPKITLHKL